MKVSIFAATAAGVLIAQSAFGQERLEINNFYPLSGETIDLDGRVFFTQDNRGHFEVVEGPIKEGPARCVGSGFGYQDGTNTIQGICIFGEGDATFTMKWKAGEKGEANTWTIVAATGAYKGMTGEGIATTAKQVMYKAMPLRQTHIVGTVEMPKE